jgi:hypothetical protein
MMDAANIAIELDKSDLQHYLIITQQLLESFLLPIVALVAVILPTLFLS